MRFDVSTTSKYATVAEDGCSCIGYAPESYEWASGWTVRMEPHAATDEKVEVRLRMTKKAYYGKIGMCAADGKTTFWLGAQKESVAVDSISEQDGKPTEAPMYRNAAMVRPTKGFDTGQELLLELTKERTLIYRVDGAEIARQADIPAGWVFAVGGCGDTAFELVTAGAA